jgi:hypothetical protein
MTDESHEEKQKPYSKQELKELEALRPYVPFLDVMSSISPQQSDVLIPYLKPNVHDSLCACISNSLFNFEGFEQKCKEKCAHVLKSKLDHYAFLSDKRHTCSKGLLKKRGKYLEETSSGLPTLVSAVLPSFSKALTRAAKQKAEATAKRKLNSKKKVKKAKQ